MMPRICEFHGIAIYLYYADHGPPHFHAFHGGAEAVIAIRDGQVLSGNLPRRIIDMARTWGRLRRRELLENWDLARAGLPLRRLAPPE